MQTARVLLFVYISKAIRQLRMPPIMGTQANTAGGKQMKKLISLLAVAALGAGFAATAQAHVSIGVGIGVPAYPVYAAPPVYYAPPPAYYAPAPVYYGPPPVYYGPPPVVYAPPGVFVGGYWRHPGWRHHRHGDHGREWR
jgi:hypothetical protein